MLDSLGSEPSIGVVAIGRNEGDRLIRCLNSALIGNATVVYVDSGSSDDSAEAARRLGVEVVELDLRIPFTAARARNTGFERLLAIQPRVKLVQFVDGDCEIVADWLARAYDVLLTQPEIAVVCGRRRERYPESSIYNSLCDMEWNSPIGEAIACGGDALIRVAAFQQVGGYDAALIAGEEPEMCLRLRRVGWRILRIDADMTLHDAAMTSFSQWWKRTMRAGHAYAESAAMYGASAERFRVHEVRSIWLWGLIIPMAAVLLTAPTRGISLILWALCLFRLSRRVRLAMIERGFSPHEAQRYALFVVLGKFPEALGQIRYWLGHCTGLRSKVIEYK